MKRLRYLLAWLTVRPRRWFFGNCAWKGCQDARWLPRKSDYGWPRKYEWPNVHWKVLHATVYRFFGWLRWDAWRHLCEWDSHGRKTFPWMARVVMRIGQTTAGAVISGGECWHCANPDGDPVQLSEEDGDTFRLTRTWTTSSQCGTDHRFSGVTICPRCGYEQEYEEGSL